MALTDWLITALFPLAVMPVRSSPPAAVLSAPCQGLTARDYPSLPGLSGQQSYAAVEIPQETAIAAIDAAGETAIAASASQVAAPPQNIAAHAAHAAGSDGNAADDWAAGPRTAAAALELFANTMVDQWGGNEFTHRDLVRAYADLGAKLDWPPVAGRTLTLALKKVGATTRTGPRNKKGERPTLVMLPRRDIPDESEAAA